MPTNTHKSHDMSTKRCAVCARDLPATSFSHRQLRKTIGQGRQCLTCADRARGSILQGNNRRSTGEANAADPRHAVEREYYERRPSDAEPPQSGDRSWEPELFLARELFRRKSEQAEDDDGGGERGGDCDGFGTFLAIRWPVSTAPCGELYPFRVPVLPGGGLSSVRCRGCRRRLGPGEFCAGNRYFDDETGYDLCVRCLPGSVSVDPISEGLDSVGLALAIAGRNAVPTICQEFVFPVACSFSGNAAAAEPLLLPPHSDCGFPRIELQQSYLPASVTLSVSRPATEPEGRPVSPVCVDSVWVHNWFSDTYPDLVIVEASPSARLDDDDAFTEVGRSSLPKASVFTEVSLSPSVAHFVRLTFPSTLSPGRVTLGVVHFPPCTQEVDFASTKSAAKVS
jgi:hypothetical protein